MIVKPLEVPKHLLQMEALNRRLLHSHPKKMIIDRRSRNLRAGYNGELSLEFPLGFLSKHEFHIFHNLRLRDSNAFFQIDILVVTKSFLLIIEVKNIDGQVLFDELGQSIRIKNDKEEVFQNPIYQVNLQHLRLMQWLHHIDIPTVPIEKAVVYSSTSTILKNVTNDKHIAEIIMHKDKILPRIEQLQRKYKSPCLSEQQLQLLFMKLLSAQTPEKNNVLEKYDIQYDELVKGVFCLDCGARSMMRIKGKWKCRVCHAKSEIAHRHSLQDYTLLVGERITNRVLRDFLQLESADVAKRILKKVAYLEQGKYKGRRYYLKADIL